LIATTLFAVMVSLGLSLPLNRLQEFHRQRRMVVRVLIGSCLLVPLVGVLVLLAPLGMSPPARLAVALMALCPSAPLTMHKAHTSGGDRGLAALLQVSAATLAILSVPLLALAFKQIFHVSGWEITPDHVAGQIIKVQLLPLGIGVVLRRWQPALADRLQAPFSRIANLLLLVLIVLILVKVGPQIAQFLLGDPAGLTSVVVMVVASLAIGQLLGAGPPHVRTTTALVTSMRNPGLALLLAHAYAPHVKGLTPGILAYLLLTVLISLPYLRWRRSRAAATAG
jgi:predicted Na+-dependent transporter